MLPRLRTILICAALIALTFGVYSGVIYAGFVQYDDSINVYQNPYLDTDAMPSLGYVWTHSHLGPVTVYRPIVYDIYALVTHATRLSTPQHILGSIDSKMDPHPLHWLNLAVHIANVLLVFVFVRRLLFRLTAGGTIPDARLDLSAAIGAALFGVHPLQVEAVAWITGLTELLGTFGTLIALFLYLRFAETELGPARRVRYVLATLAFLFALFSKPTAVVTPLIALTFDVLLVRRPPARSIKALSPWFIAAIAITPLFRNTEPLPGRDVVIPIWQRLCVAGDAALFYARHTLYPWPCTIDYGRSPAFLMRQPAGHWSWLALVAVSVAVGVLWKRRPHAAALPLAWLAGLLPVLGLISFRFQTYSTVADRYTYLPMFAVAIAVAWLVARAPALPAYAASLAAVGLCTVLSFTQVVTWNNSFALFNHATDVNPRSVLAWQDLGEAYGYENRLSDASECFERVIALNPGLAAPHLNLGLALARMGRYQEAIDQLLIARQTMPNNQTLNETLATSYAALHPDALK